MVGIVDEALPEGGTDALKISTYKDALVNFIKKTDTPMTIGVQGEWGSGKTSLLNQIWNDLDRINEGDSSRDDFKQIWINSWEHSLLCTPEESLMKIIGNIISELTLSDINKNRSDNLKRNVGNIMKGALRIGSSMTLGAAGVDAVDNMFNGNENSIKQLRDELKVLVEDIKKLETNNFGKIVIYVDDLDRIEPKNAVRILELLKNIFNIKDCVFILAIDYQVVVKGLVDKFGPPTPENDWEFRAFFDKIIQLPFVMPMGKYDIANYVLGLLGQIDFYSGAEELDPDLINQFVTKSIGGNPRSIKRLVNSLSLITTLSKAEAENDGRESLIYTNKDRATILFAMVCLQISHPKVYQLFADNPDFTQWDEDYAYRETQKIEETDKNWEKNYKQAIENDDFDQEWEKCLFRICYTDPRRRAKAHEVSQFISLFEEEFDKKTIISLIEKAIGQTAVTSISSSDSVNVRPPKKSRQRHYVIGYDAWLENFIERFEMAEKFPDFPSKESEEVIKSYLTFIKAEPYNAVDFEQGKLLSDHDSNYVIKYAGGISIYYMSKKIAGLGLHRNLRGEFVTLRFSKHPKYNNQPLILTDSNIEFNHINVIRDLDEEARTFKGSPAGVDWMETECVAKDINFSIKSMEFLTNISMDSKTNPKVKDDLITQQKLNAHIEAFKSKRRNANQYKEAVKFLEEYYKEKKKRKVKY